MVLKELLGPTDLFKAQALYIHEMMEVIVIRKDENFIFATF